MATCKELRRQLRTAISEERVAHVAVREANARVVAATKKLPPNYVETASATAERVAVKPLVDVAQAASNRWWTAADELVNKRAAVASCGRKAK